MLKFKMQTICLKLLNLLLSGNESETVIEKIFKILKKVKEYNESFLHLILPSFCRILNNSKNNENVVFVRGIINYIKSILDFESSKLLLTASFVVHLEYHSFSDKMHLGPRRCITRLPRLYH